MKHMSSKYNLRSPEHAKATLYAITKNHIPAIDFSKQVDRKDYMSSMQESITSETLSRVKENVRKVRGLIPMAKQLARSESPPALYLPDYKVDYKLVLPRIQLKVNYQRQIKDVENKYKRRIPLTEPYNYKKAFSRLLS
eukprot:TRINITY_DN9338_c0_g4_i1.p2 TRINITY_DN9338_c0_g4~~TRINITY_DN9338_c0_g4_i1.p2  ORF type:complete len:139 (+),score=20.30 TRINITY_DN9338_c0_g4_i1:548-964(+)